MFKKLMVFVAATLLMFGLAACGSTNNEPWDGEWKADGMTATIDGETVEIHFEDDGTRALYWKGTFEPPFETIHDGEIISVKNAETDLSLMGSLDDTKIFKAKDGKINFTLGMMGVEKTVSLAKQ